MIKKTNIGFKFKSNTRNVYNNKIPNFSANKYIFRDRV